MVEEQRRRIEGQMTKMVEEIDKAYIRKMQGEMHRCAANCCDNESYSMQKLQTCVDSCSAPLNRAQNYVQGEFERVQNRLQRCVMDCNDKIKDSMGPNPTQDEVNKFSDDFEKCATKCVDSYIDHIPTLQKTMKKVLESKKFEQ